VHGYEANTASTPEDVGESAQRNAALLRAAFPLVGLLAAIFILPEVYGYKEGDARR
jgi:hypothetical protein